MATCTLVKRGWDNGVTIEARVGLQDGCDAKQLVGQQRMKKDETWDVDVGATWALCYRRDGGPGPSRGQLD